MKIAILGTRGIPNNYGGFEQCAEYLSIGLVQKGHEVTVYNPNFHPYEESSYQGVKIIKKPSPQRIVGNSAANFIYDFLCLKDALNRDIDIILELGLITSSLSIIFCNHRDKVITTNLDGLEWKRSKWSYIIQKLTKTLEKYGVKYSDYLVADNLGIQQYINKEYNKTSKYIPYGAEEFNTPEEEMLSEYNVKKYNYLLSIARLEPENNLEIMFNGYISSQCKLPYLIVGNHLTRYADYLKDKYRNTGIIFLGGIFNKQKLDNLRFFSKYYLHGHSVGGTNPALLEAMAAGAFIFANDNQFNQSVIEKNGYYFRDENELASLLKNRDLLQNKSVFINMNRKKIRNIYNWKLVVDEYEKYFQEILNQH